MKTSDKNVLKIRIYGAEYSVSSYEDITHIKKVAEYVDEKMRMVDASVRVDSSLKVAILACVNIASELFKLREEYQRISDQLEEKIKKINSLIENRI